MCVLTVFCTSVLLLGAAVRPLTGMANYYISCSPGGSTGIITCFDVIFMMEQNDVDDVNHTDVGQ